MAGDDPHAADVLYRYTFTRGEARAIRSALVAAVEADPAGPRDSYAALVLHIVDTHAEHIDLDTGNVVT